MSKSTESQDIKVQVKRQIPRASDIHLPGVVDWVQINNAVSDLITHQHMYDLTQEPSKRCNNVIFVFKEAQFAHKEGYEAFKKEMIDLGFSIFHPKIKDATGNDTAVDDERTWHIRW